MADQEVVSTTEARRDPVQLRIERDTRFVLGALGYGIAALCLGVVWFFHWLFAQIGHPDLSPMVVYGIAAGLGLPILAACVLRWKASVSRLIAFVALSGVYLGLLANSGAPAKLSRFQAAYRSIRVGMNAAEVRAAVDAQFPDGKMTIEPYPGGCFVGPLDPGDGWYNAELFAVTFRNGLVVSKRYLPD